MKTKILLLLLLVSLPLMGFGCKGGDRAAQEAGSKPVTIKFWGVWDEKDYWQEIFDDYKLTHPNVSFDYRKLRTEEYERALLEAWAEDRGPDIFMVHNTWVNSYRNKITPLPAKVTLPVQTVQGSLKKEVVWVLQDFPTLTTAQVENLFVPVVKEDAVFNNTIYALPIAIDTLALYYNRDIFQDAEIVLPPTTWAEFKNAVQKINRLDENNEIVRSAVAMGRADNVDRASDIVSVLMMQNGTQMTSTNNLPAFDVIPPGTQAGYNPGEQALIFYTDFANPIKEVYTWNMNFPDSLDAFAQGKTAMMFGYSYHEPLIRSRGPKINFDITALPQIDPLAQKYNFANYWLNTVSQKSTNLDVAWDFLLFATTKAEEVNKYLSHNSKSPALRETVNQKLQEPTPSPFVKQALTAESWYHGLDAETAESIMLDMIHAINQGSFSNITELVRRTVSRLKQTYVIPNYAQ